MLQKLKDLLAAIKDNAVPWATRVSLLIGVILDIIAGTGVTDKPQPLALAASVDVPSFAQVQLEQTIKELEKPAANRLGDGTLLKNLLPILLALLQKFIGA